MERCDRLQNVAFTAPTGVAACNIRGLTVHSWAGIGIGKGGDNTIESTVGRILRNREAKKRWLRTEVLVIDEISMLSSDVFDMLAIIGSRVRNDPR